MAARGRVVHASTPTPMQTGSTAEAATGAEPVARAVPGVQKVFSHSSLSAYENCPKQYHYRYVEKRKVEVESIEAFLGKRVHEILERLYRFVAEGRVPSLERVLYRYHANWDEGFDAERIRIVREEMEPDFYRRLGARCIENHYRGHYPFDAEKTVGIEKRIQFALDDSGDYRVRGVIDRLARGRDGVLEIHDYKTGQRVPHQRFLDRDRQLALYELGIRETLGEAGEIRLVWLYLLSNQVRISRRRPEQLEELRHATRSTIDRIRCETEWEPRTGPLCSWCEFRALCPAQAEAPGA